jgi:hygromycin-B 4-O-kinase
MSKPLISTEHARLALEARWPGVSAFSPLVEGEESRAFRFERGGQDFVLRINRELGGFAKDDLVQRLFGDQLPIPQIMQTGQLEDGLAFCISRMAPGTTLQALPADRLAPALQPVADLLGSIAAINVGAIAGFGPFDAQGWARFTGWPAFVASIGDVAHYNWSRASIEGIAPWLEQVMALSNACPDARHLVHGDFGSNNVLFAEGRISGVIDWSEAMVGDGLYDVANILFWRTWLDCMEQQAAFFEANRPTWLARRDLLRCYQLRIGLDLIYQCALAGDRPMLDWARRRCGEVADF